MASFNPRARERRAMRRRVQPMRLNTQILLKNSMDWWVAAPPFTTLTRVQRQPDRVLPGNITGDRLVPRAPIAIGLV
jgi:hypothetical protein